MKKHRQLLLANCIFLVSLQGFLIRKEKKFTLEKWLESQSSKSANPLKSIVHAQMSLIKTFVNLSIEKGNITSDC